MTWSQKKSFCLQAQFYLKNKFLGLIPLFLEWPIAKESLFVAMKSYRL